MTRTVWLLVPLALLTGPPLAAAQRLVRNNQPRAAESVPVVSAIFPPGLTRGQTTEWTVTGRNLGTVETFLVSGGGVEVVAIKSRSPGKVVAGVRASADAVPGFREVYAEASDGLSNLLVVRVDHLSQTTEAEPNDDPAHATRATVGAAVAGTLRPQDLDYFRFSARAGQRLTIEVEAQRLGTALEPVATLLSARGAALAQAKPTRGAERDCRLNITIPRDGDYLVLVHDNTFNGADTAGYRLRIEEAPFATGLFPLGGPRGQSVTVTASGGNLAEPLSKTLPLPDEPGAIVDPGPFDGQGGLVLAPGKLIVGEGSEVNEDPGLPSTTRLPVGTTANGRINRPGELDRYLIPVKKGNRLHVKVLAAPLGSWLDSVITLRDSQGTTLAENDDPAGNANPRGGVFGLATSTPDSELDYEAKAAGDLTLEITDRYGEGGAEYAYRLTVGPPKPDFQIKLLLANPNANRRLIPSGRRAPAGGPGSSGALNLTRGSKTPINFLVAPSGRPDRVVVKAEGLPPGVTADTVTVNFTPGRGSGRSRSALPSSGSLVLKVAPNAERGTGVLKVVGTARLDDGTQITRVATAALAIDTAMVNTNRLPPLRTVSSIPLKVVGSPEPPEPQKSIVRVEAVALGEITVPGALLQGGWIDLALGLEPASARPARLDVKAEVSGRGLAIMESNGTAARGTDDGFALRVQAAADAEPGVRTVKVRFQPANGPATERELAIIVRPPLGVTAQRGSVALPPGGSATFRVTAEREAGYSGPVEVRVAGLPPGVKMAGRTVIPPDQTGATVRLLRVKSARPLAQPAALRVFGVARLPGDAVEVDSAIRPMLEERPAEE